MARKYARDNRGRFAAKGTGATARGGRLRTEAGNKRKTQIAKLQAADLEGTIRKGGKTVTSKPQAAVIRRTPRQKARALGAMRVPASQSPGDGVSSVPRGTIGATGTARDLVKVSKALAKQPTSSSLQVKTADVFRNGGVIPGVAGTQARRAIVSGRGRVSGVFTRAVYPSPTSSKTKEFIDGRRAAFRDARRSHTPKKSRKA
jgi:hypothetical protein